MSSQQDTLLDKSWNRVTSDYHLIKVLSEGSSNLVVRAQSKATGQRVAIKQLKNVCRSEVTAIRALREISILRFLKEHRKASAQGHFPFTVIHEVLMHQAISTEGKAEVTLFIIMEELPTTLKKVLANSETQPLKDKTVAKIVYQLLCAIRFLHRAGIGHRDLKPANIFVDSNYNVKVGDFGLSRSGMATNDKFKNMSKLQVAEELVAGRQQRQKVPRRLSGRVVSRAYRPPEIILLEKDYDTRVDLWSLGCIMGELLPSTRHYIKRNERPQLILQGTCCSPHPSNGVHPTPNQNGEDQLEAIISELGGLSTADISFLTSEASIEYLEERAPSSGDKPLSWKKKFFLSDPDLVKMTKGLLKFNFHYRATAAELLSLPCFSERVQRLDIETAEPEVLELPVDTPSAYDYKSGRANLKMKEIVGFLRDALEIAPGDVR